MIRKFGNKAEAFQSIGFGKWPDATNESGLTFLPNFNESEGSDGSEPWDDWKRFYRSAIWTASEHFEISEDVWGAFAWGVEDTHTDLNYSFGWGYNVKNFALGVRCIQYNQPCTADEVGTSFEDADGLTYVCGEKGWELPEED